MVTKEQFAEIFPSVISRLQDEYHSALTSAMAEFGIDTFQRVAIFLAQVGHETAGLHYLEELGGVDYFTKHYEGRKDLGNIQPGDGNRFHGRGMIQLTGRANYKEYGGALGLPLEFQPGLAAQPIHGARIAGLFWKRHGLNTLADADDFEAITRRINGGLNGLEDRLRRWDRAKQVLGLPAQLSKQEA